MSTYIEGEIAGWFVVGVILGIIITLAVILIDTKDKIIISNSIIKHCELDLPRSQKCDLIAVPEKWNPDKVTKK